jgi:hypothetical protein
MSAASGIDRQPQPEDMPPAAETSAQFVQVKMREGEVLKWALMQARALLKSPCQPGSARARVRPTDAPSCCHIQAFAQRGEHFSDARGWCFEARERGGAAGAEGGATGRTAIGLNAFACAM